MKHIHFSIKRKALLALTPFLLLINGCTKNFPEYNSDTNGITDEQLKPDFNSIGAFFPALQNGIYPSNNGDGIAVDIAFLSQGAWAGYTMGTFPGARNMNYSLFAGWEPFSMFSVGYNSVMSPVNEIKRKGAETEAPDFWAVALILKVAAMHGVTDIFGPVPYSKFGLGGTTVEYDSQQKIYDAFFTELDQAVAALKTYIAAKPGATPFRKFDLVYKGDYTKWLKYANSLRLRLAMHIVKVDRAKAQLQAEKAVDMANGGVFTSNADNAFVLGGGLINMLHIATNVWGDVRVGAAIITYMNGYNDDRIGKYFEPSTVIPGQYVGIRTGSIIASQSDYLKFSTVSRATYSEESAVQLMNAAEVYFLRAEGALRGWNMGGNTPKELYELGITTSFNQYGVGGAASAYIADATSTPAAHTDPINPANSSPALSSITIKWDEAATNEQKLERIITQQWIANFANSTEAWTTFRRTGYPKLFPVVENNSGGLISTSIQIRRMTYLASEYTSNAAEVAKAVTLLGGPDNGGTRLWWDIPGGNF